MKKKIYRKTNNVDKYDELTQDAVELQKRGEDFGDAIIRLMALMTHEYSDFGICAIGLARAMASLKDASRQADIDVTKLYDSELRVYEHSLKDLA